MGTLIVTHRCLHNGYVRQIGSQTPDGKRGSRHRMGRIQCSEPLTLARVPAPQSFRPVRTCAAAVKWTSGVLYSAKEAAEFRAKVTAAAMTEEQRLAALRADERLPLVFLDVTIKVRSLEGRSWRTCRPSARAHNKLAHCSAATGEAA